MHKTQDLFEQYRKDFVTKLDNSKITVQLLTFYYSKIFKKLLNPREYRAVKAIMRECFKD